MRTCDENIKKSASKSRSEELNLNSACGLNLAPKAVLKSVQSGAGEQIYFSDFSAIDWRTVQATVFHGRFPTRLQRQPRTFVGRERLR